MILLALGLFGAVFINMLILQIKATATILISIGIFIFVIIIVNLFSIYVKNSKREYDFFQDHITDGKKEISLAQPFQSEQNMIDRSFNTATIKLGKEKLTSIPNDQRIINYIQSLVEFQNRA